MNCQEIRPLLDPFAEEELSPVEEQHVRDHLDRCLDCQKRAFELKRLVRTLARLPQAEPRATLMARTLERVQRQRRPVPGWWPPFLTAGVAVALTASLVVIAQAVMAFHRAGGGEYLSLIGSYPHLLVRYPWDATMAVLEALPVSTVVLALASTLLACLLAAQLLATSSIIRSWPNTSGRP